MYEITKLQYCLTNHLVNYYVHVFFMEAKQMASIEVIEYYTIQNVSLAS